MQLYSFFDKQLRIYGAPLCFHNVYEIARFVEHISVSSPSYPYITNPEKFSVLQVGTFNIDTGEVDPPNPDHETHIELVEIIALYSGE